MGTSSWMSLISAKMRFIDMGCRKGSLREDALPEANKQLILRK
jgi:hypothetical protein